ncbi:hypothetical protein O5404_07535 (plasmid) [Borrelia miyamotoi]|uniref:Uncharacterized protein n=2 Tax=Borrelia miyamotoi TaxID=47466 RepID=A0A481YE03_9SPIR|nr:hypothetical protein [Borrelia miyamotoi]ATQ16671.1 hypothetical protein CNO13_05750 [Borrelia miyamotoi]QBK62739.1 hypothetical protein EZU67_06290 [Borrelia miyamotoi]QBK63979.1 hypothetical protein EZU68_06285 [Borrelia miyamotoi]QBK65279.1 hypothetical protein EZU69_06315 [Borrelia miyamotoi]WAZ72857.1 hypothetical protein O5404_07535 [Borrelia miyamotoi]
MNDIETLNMWINITSIDYLRMMCIREDNSIDIPLSLKGQLLECLRYSKSILDLYHIGSESYSNWLLMLLDVVYLEVFNSRCVKVEKQKDCKFRQLLHQLDSLFIRVDSSAFVSIG